MKTKQLDTTQLTLGLLRDMYSEGLDAGGVMVGTATAIQYKERFYPNWRLNRFIWMLLPPNVILASELRWNRQLQHEGERIQF